VLILDRIEARPYPEWKAATSFGDDMAFEWLTGKRKQRVEDLSDAEFFALFQSMGDDCEFGLVQTHFGTTQIGLCKSAYTPTESLMLMLETRFADLLKPDLPLRLDAQEHTDGKTEYAAIVDLYGARYHTQVRVPADEGELIVRERKRLALLARTFIEDLEDGEKIFVLKRAPPCCGIKWRRFASGCGPMVPQPFYG
jgi:hypothetical protein